MENCFMLYYFSTEAELRASSNRKGDQWVGKAGEICLGHCLSSFPSHLKIWWERVTDVRRKKKARLLTGKVHIPSPPVTWSSSFVGAMQYPGRNTCPPALPPSLPWQSPFPISLLHRAVKKGWPKQRWIESTSSCLWAGCGAGSKGQWAGCWSPALMLLVLAEEPWAGCCCGEHSEPSPGCTEGLSCGTSLQPH